MPGRAALLAAHAAALRRHRRDAARAARRRQAVLRAAPGGRRQLQAVRAQEGGTDRVLIDPTLKSDARRVTCRWTGGAPRRTARTWCTGSRRMAARTRSCTSSPWPTARTCPSSIPNTEAAHPQWLDDGSGFFYNQLTGSGRHARALPRQPGALPPARHRSGRRPDPDEARPGCAGAVRAHPDAGHCHLPGLALRAAAAAATCAARCACSSPRWPMPWPARRTGCRSPTSRTRSPTSRSTARRCTCCTTRARRAAGWSSVPAPRSGPRGRRRGRAAERVVIEDLHLARDGLYLRMLDGGISAAQAPGARGTP